MECLNVYLYIVSIYIITHRPCTCKHTPTHFMHILLYGIRSSKLHREFVQCCLFEVTTFGASLLLSEDISFLPSSSFLFILYPSLTHGYMKQLCVRLLSKLTSSISYQSRRENTWNCFDSILYNIINLNTWNSILCIIQLYWLIDIINIKLLNFEIKIFFLESLIYKYNKKWSCKE